MSSPSLSIDCALGEFDPISALQTVKTEADWIGLRFSSETHHHRSARNGHMESNQVLQSRGVMIEALVGGQIAYAATSNLSPQGINQAARIATEIAQATAKQRRSDLSIQQRSAGVARHEGPSRIPLDQIRLEDFTSHLIQATQRLKVSDAIVTAVAEATLVESVTHYVTSSGADLRQQHLLSYQNFGAIAAEGSETQQRSLNGPTARCLQSGLESFNWDELLDECERTGQEALALLQAENCPDETMDLILSPDQMLLQIHESIGHPLELDRILGDERNYAGWSFVKPEDFGSLQYGSPLMNVVFDPGLSGEFASYAFDDGGAPAKREYLIREGLLIRGLGGLESQSRSGIPGVANFRSSGWNRAPIDRMANINLEPGNSSFEAMLSQVERGVFMQSNRSWSIDDYRNKFQFGCEYAQLIEEGRLTRVLKNPNYRGITLPFWHSLAAVGQSDTFRMYGTPYCGKGEPNQMIRVGHASPTCLFKNIEVFGGAR
jgi:predicted Zn-dependent protease